jgi:NADPH2:quinone reductase
MRAIQVGELSGPSALRLVDLADPEPAPDQVLIETHAAGVTFPDVLLTRGQYQITPDLPFVPGSEVAGVVRQAPPESGLRPGDRVAAFPGLGGFAELVVASPQATFRLPDAVPFTQAAALPMNYLTMHFALVRRGRLAPGETVLVHGAAGGIGTAAVQLASALGAHVIGVVSSEAKAAVARQAGADAVVMADDFLRGVRDRTGGRGVDVVVDPVGGERITDSLRSLAPEGRHLVIGFTEGAIPTVRVNRLLLNNIDVVGVGWGAFWLREPSYLQQQWGDLRPLLESGAIDPVVGEILPLDDAAAAVARLDERRALGKVVLSVRS